MDLRSPSGGSFFSCGHSVEEVMRSFDRGEEMGIKPTGRGKTLLPNGNHGQEGGEI